MSIGGFFRQLQCRTTRGQTVVCYVIVVAMLAISGCDDGDAGEQPTGESADKEVSTGDEGDRFSGVVCAAEDEAMAKPGDDATIFGAVWAPEGRLAREGSEGAGSPGRSAHAEESTKQDLSTVGSGVRVWLARADEHGEPTGDELIATVTDDYGRWCIVIPDGVDAGPHLVLSAEGEEERLRRLVHREGGMEIDARFEALLRLLIEEGHRPAELDPHTYRGLEEHALSAVEKEDPPLRPRPATGIESYVARLMETMEDDQRLMKAIDEVAGF